MCRRVFQPRRGIGFYGDIERRLDLMRGHNRSGGLGAIMRDPAFAQPGGRIERRIERCNSFAALARHAAQNGIDESGIARIARSGCKPHGKIDRGMVGHVEKQDLRRAEQERDFDLRDVLGQTLFHHGCVQCAQRAETAEYGRRQHADERAVAVGKRGKAFDAGGGIERFVERAAAIEDGEEGFRGDLARGKARGVGVFDFFSAASRAALAARGVWKACVRV
jgi:hypothetical protein